MFGVNPCSDRGNLCSRCNTRIQVKDAQSRRNPEINPRLLSVRGLTNFNNCSVTEWKRVSPEPAGGDYSSELNSRPFEPGWGKGIAPSAPEKAAFWARTFEGSSRWKLLPQRLHACRVGGGERIGGPSISENGIG